MFLVKKCCFVGKILVKKFKKKLCPILHRLTVAIIVKRSWWLLAMELVVKLAC
jgi:hypothetical protein